MSLNVEPQCEIDETDSTQYDQQIHEQEINENLFLNFKNDLKKAILKCGTIVYFVIGFTLVIVNIAQQLDPNQDNGKKFLKLLNGLLICFYIINCIINFYNHNINAKQFKTNLNVKNHLLLFIITLPLSVVVIVVTIIRVVQISLFPDDTDNSMTAMLCFKILFLISVLVLLIDQSQMEAGCDVPENYDKYIHKMAITITIIGLMVALLLFLVEKEIILFQHLSQHYYNISYHSPKKAHDIDSEAYQRLKVINDFLYPVHIAFLAVCISSLLGSSMKMVNVRVYQVPSPTPSLTLHRQLKIPFRALISGVVIITMPIIIFLLITYKWENYGSIVYNAMFCIIYCLGIIFSFIQIREVKLWPLIPDNINLISEKSLIWMGSIGYILFIINTFSITLETLSELAPDNKYYRDIIWTAALSFLNQLFLCLQIILQNIIVELILHRSPRIPTEETVKKYCPPMVLLCLNVSCVIVIMYMSTLKSILIMNNISIDLFHFGMYNLSSGFALIYRLYGALFFGVLLSKVHE